MGIIKVQGMQGLKGLSGLSESEQALWRKRNAEKLKGQPFSFEDILYANQQYVEKFGIDAFHANNKETRDAQFRHTILAEEYEKRFSPYEEKKDDKGNPIYVVNPKKGFGNKADYEKYKSLDDQGMQELLESNYTPKWAIDDASHRKVEEVKKIDPMHAFGTEVSEALVTTLKNDDNENLLNKIYADSNKRAFESTDDSFLNFYESKMGLDDTETKESFIRDYINPETAKDGIGNGQMMVFLNKNSEEVEDLSIDDMRQYMARYDALLNKYGDPKKASEVTASWTNQYAIDHRGWVKDKVLHAKDFTIGMGSYFASQAIAANQVKKDLTGTEHQVFMDLNTREIVPTSKIKHDKEGYFYVENGRRQDVSSLKLTDGELYSMGRNTDGTEVSDFFNPIYWQDAERFNTWSRDEQKEYAKLGYSPYSILYEPGESALGWSAFKMGVYGTVDAGTTFITGGVGKGIVWGTTKALGAASKAVKVANVTSKVLRAAPAITSTGGVAQAYRQGTFSESLQRNVEAIDNKYIDKFQHEFADMYKNNEAFKAVIDKSTDIVYQQLLKEKQQNPIPQSKDSNVTRVVNGQSVDLDLLTQAKQIVANQYVNKQIEKFKNTDDYAKDMEEAIKTANVGAAITGYTDALKYGMLNTVGWRSYLFKDHLNPTKFAASSFKKPGLYERLEKAGSTWGKTKVWGGAALKTAWNGGWTNYTDEMQSWGGKFIANDSFDSYMAGKYDGEGIDSSYGVMDGLMSYMAGAIHAMPLKSSIEAGVVGAIGSVAVPSFNVAGTTSTLLTKEGRASLYTDGKLSVGKAINSMFSNPLMNEYYESKAIYEAKQKYGEEAAKLIEQSEKDRVNIIKGASLQLVDATKEGDNATKQFMSAVIAIHNLQTMAKQYDPETLKARQSFLGKVKQLLVDNFGPDAAETSEGNAYMTELMSQSESYQQALEVLDAINSGNMSDTMMKELLVDYYKHNPSVAQSAENDAIAIQNIQQRAQELSRANEIYNDVQNKLDEYEKTSGKQVDALTRYTIGQRMALKQFIDDRIKTLSEETGVSTIPTVANIHGTKEAIDKQIADIEKLRGELPKKQEEAKKLLEEKEKVYKEYEESHPVLTAEDHKKLAELEAQRQAAQKQIDYYNEMDNLYKNNVESLRHEQEGDGEVLSATTILNLDAESMSIMLDPANKGNYSKEQQFEIDAARANLQLNSEGKLEKINELADLSRRQSANEKALYQMMQNPEAASVALETILNSEIQKRNQRLERQTTEEFDAFLENVKNSEQTEEAKKLTIRNQLRKVKKNTLDYFEYLATKENPVSSFADNIDAIREAKEFVPVIEDINTILKTYEGTSEYDLLSKVIDFYINQSANKEELLQNIKQTAEVPDTHKFFKDLAEKLGLAKETREAVTTETKEKKKERENKEEEKKAVEERKEKVKEKEEKEIINEEKEKPATEEKTKEESKEEKKEKVKEEQNTEKTEVKEEKVEEKTEVKEQSPTEEQQLKEVKDDSNIDTTLVNTDSTDQGNSVTETQQGLIGNRLYSYDLNTLVVEGRLVQREFDGELAVLNQWLSDNNVHIQEIIDRELFDIIKANPKVQFMYVNHKSGRPNDNALHDVGFTVVEYTDKVARVHDSSLGSIIDSNGKKYLIIGTLGYNGGKAKGTNYRKLLYNLKVEAMNSENGYFTQHPTERFYVSETNSTEVSQITSGRIVRQLPKDKEVTLRPVSEILSDKERNPYGYTLGEVGWAVQYGNKLHVIRAGSKPVYPPKDTNSNLGNVFILVPTASGTLIPAYIKPIFLSEVNKDTPIYNQIYSLLQQIGDTSHANRVAAINQLVQMLVLTEEGNQILVGTESIPTVTLMSKGTKIATYNVTSPSFNLEKMIDRIITELNPRINITLKALLDENTLKDLDASGILTTDLAYLGTVNASYTLYDIIDGKPNKEEKVPIPEPVDGIQSNSQIQEQKEKNSINIGKDTYRYREDRGWIAPNGQTITDPALIRFLETSKQLKERMKADPDISGTDIYGNPANYYLLNIEGETTAVKVKPNGKFEIMTKEDTARVLKSIENRKKQKEREEAAKKTLENGEEARLNSMEDLTIDTVTPTPTSPDTLLDPNRNPETATLTGLEEFDNPTETKENNEAKEEKPVETKKERDKKTIEDINNGSVLHKKEEGSAYNTKDIVRNAGNRKRLLTIMKEKGFNGSAKDVTKWLQDHNMPTENITDLEAWFDMLQNCR